MYINKRTNTVPSTHWNPRISSKGYDYNCLVLFSSWTSCSRTLSNSTPTLFSIAADVVGCCCVRMREAIMLARAGLFSSRFKIIWWICSWTSSLILLFFVVPTPFLPLERGDVGEEDVITEEAGLSPCAIFWKVFSSSVFCCNLICRFYRYTTK